MYGHSNLSQERRDYLIDLHALTRESGQVLIYFLKQKYKKNERKFFAKDYPIAFSSTRENLEDSQKELQKLLSSYTHITFTGEFSHFVMRRLNIPTTKEVFPDSFALDIFSKETLSLTLNENTCKLDKAIGILDFTEQFPKYTAKVFYSLDPTDLSGAKNALLAAIFALDFTKNPKERIISPSDFFEFKELGFSPHIPNFSIQIALTLIRKPCSHIPLNEMSAQLKDMHYFVMKERLGEGSFSGVDHIAAKLKFDIDGKLICVPQNLALKLLQLTSVEDQFVKDEHEVTRIIGEPKVKPLFFFGQKTAGIFMQLIEGEDLQKIIHRDQMEKNPDKLLTMKQRLRMIILALRKYRKRIEMNGVIHRDLKGTNTKYQGDQKVSIFDYGLALYSKNNKINAPKAGTKAYAPPEFFNDKPFTVKSDVFSFCWMIVDILRGTNQHIARKQDDELKQPVPITLDTVKSLGLFSGLKVSEQNQNTIIQLLAKGFSENPDRRPNFDTLLNDFEKIAFDQVFESEREANLASSERMLKAHTQGIELRNKLYQFGKKNTDTTAKVADELEAIFIAQFAASKNMEAKELRHYLDVADLEMLIPIQDALGHVHKIIRSFKEHLAILENLKVEVESTLKAMRALGNAEKVQNLQILKYRLNKLFELMNCRPMLEAIVTLNAKYETNIQDIRQLLDIVLDKQSVSKESRYAEGVFVRLPSPTPLNHYFREEVDHADSADSDSVRQSSTAPHTPKNGNSVNSDTSSGRSPFVHLTGVGLLFNAVNAQKVSETSSNKLTQISQLDL